MTDLRPQVNMPPHLSKAWLKSLPDDTLWEVYNHFKAIDDYLGHGESVAIGPKLRRVRDIMERRGLL